jgi:tRNA (guanine37-N1)-methyltransferase
VRIDVITIFPDYFAPLELALLGKARARGIVDVRVHDLRQWTYDLHRTVDDAPYGGGPGMVMKVEPWWEALTEVTGRGPVPAADRTPETAPGHIIVPTPAGSVFTQSVAEELAAQPWLVFCCGRYEGIDSRVAEAWADRELSIGDYVLSGGEVAAITVIEAVTRLLPGVMGNEGSAGDDSFSSGLLEGPSYTRPPAYDGREVPEVLLSGDHAAVARWRRREALFRTARYRPDLLAAAALTDDDRAMLRAGGFPVPAEGVAQ